MNRYFFFAPLVAIAALSMLALACGETQETRQPEAIAGPALDVEALTDCEIVWAKISNADLRGQRDEEGQLKELARDLGCLQRPDSISHDIHTEVDSLPLPQPPEYLPDHYKIGYSVCGSDPEETFRQAGTRNPEEAAEWFIEGSTGTVARRSQYQGCLDALEGQPSRFD